MKNEEFSMKQESVARSQWSVVREQKSEAGSRNSDHRPPASDLRLRTSFFILQSSFCLLCVLAAVTQKVSGARDQVSGPDTSHRAPDTSHAHRAPDILVIPKSQFGALPQSGKDPFYPDSARHQRKVSLTQTNQMVAVAPEVRIHGFSDNASRPLVIINNVTFGEGDEQMVTTIAGRARVRCLEIRTQDQAVEIEINGQRRELKFLDRK